MKTNDHNKQLYRDMQEDIHGVRALPYSLAY